MLKTLVSNGTPIKDIAKMWGVSRTIIYRFLDRFESKKKEIRDFTISLVMLVTSNYF